MNHYIHSQRLQECFNIVKKEKRSALVSFITAGDPDYLVSLRILDGLPQAGADIIELGMPFSDPMADGPSIQKSSLRSLNNGQDMDKTFKMVHHFRKSNNYTPIILMGYFNPIYRYGVDNFIQSALSSGVDGLIIVDTPYEEDEELTNKALENQIDMIRLTTPTSDDTRLQHILQNVSGFIYYISILGITGTASAPSNVIKQAVTKLRDHSNLPIAVGFGIKTAEQISDLNNIADALVVGSAIVDKIDNSIVNHCPDDEIVNNVLHFVAQLSEPLMRNTHKQHNINKEI